VKVPLRAIEFGEALTGDRTADAFARRAIADRQMTAFFERYDLLICPAVQMAPFPVKKHWPPTG
jgi:amidase